MTRNPGRNVIDAETAERNRALRGRLTFNAFPPDGYCGLIMVFAAVRLGDHAHVEVQSGRWTDDRRLARHSGTGNPHVGLAGRMVLRWHEWIDFRDRMDTMTPYRIAEVECPSDAQLRRYVTTAPNDEGDDVFRYGG